MAGEAFMKIVATAGTEEIAQVYIAEFAGGKRVEFCESVQPPFPRREKWVLIVSTLFGCPVGCLMCDAGQTYGGKLSAEQILAQIDFLVKERYPDGVIDVEKFKIQFARMGEPAFNPAVLDVLEALRNRYRAPGLIPSLSTIAPARMAPFFERLLEIKKSHYAAGAFQFQFSVHSTDDAWRDRLAPVRKWSFSEMAAYGERFFEAGDRKITLNFALAREAPVTPSILARFFDPGKFLIKITPLNPTYKAREAGLSSYLDPCAEETEDSLVVKELRREGYDVIVSIGEVEENRIGSNCGQYVLEHLKGRASIPDGYTYGLTPYGGRRQPELVSRNDLRG
jgi:23S rRNA (adenine2503-C2)-methyltransferase